MSITATDAAIHIVNFCIDENQPISNLQLQKILYFCQVESYRTRGKRLFDDDFEAWRYGPVIPGVYRLFSIFGGLKIKHRVVETARLSFDESRLVERVARDLRRLHPWELVGKTHSKGSPWDLTNSGCTIPKDLIAQSAR